MRPRRLLLTLAVVSCAAAGVLTAPATAWDDHRLVDRLTVAPGVVREVFHETSPNGPVSVQVLRFRLDDARVSVRPELARGTIPGRETVSGTLHRIGGNAVAAVNANFFNPACPPTDPDGDPCGLIVRDGIVLSENVLNAGEWPGGFALFDPAETWRERPWAVGNEGFEAFLRFRDGTTIAVDGVDRQPASGETIAFNRAFGVSTGTGAGTVEVAFEGLQLRARTSTETTLPPINQSGNTGIPEGGTVIAATGEDGAELAQRDPGEPVEVFAYTAGTDWNGATQAIGAGPMIVRNGQLTDGSEWYSEGFAAAHHQLHPRTVVAFTSDGEMLLITIDGRRAGSVGMTTQQTQHLMQHLGVWDAVMMDGGGSTTMAVDDRVVNVPSGNERAVASSLVVYTNVETPAVTRLSGPDRFTTAAQIARAGWPGGVSSAVLANGGGFPDALAGGPLAADRDIPLLLTMTDGLHPATLQALSDLQVRDITVLGGPAAINDGVVAELQARGYRVTRQAGEDRTATAAAIARVLGAPGGRAFLSAAGTFPDALSATVPAARSDAPLLLTWTDHLAAPTAAALADLGVSEVLVAGGPAAVSDAVLNDLRARGMRVTRIAGPDRFATSTALLDWAAANTGLPTTAITLASGDNFPDALAGGPLAARREQGVLLSNPLDVDRSPALRSWLDTHELDQATILGGRAAMATWLAHQLQGAIDRE